jgi:hypothetical protein
MQIAAWLTWGRVASAQVGTGEALLSPSFEHRHRDGIRKIQTALTRQHRQSQTGIGAEFGQLCSRQTASFRAKNQNITRLKSDLGVVSRRLGGERETTPTGN